MILPELLRTWTVNHCGLFLQCIIGSCSTYIYGEDSFLRRSTENYIFSRVPLLQRISVKLRRLFTVYRTIIYICTNYMYIWEKTSLPLRNLCMSFGWSVMTHSGYIPIGQKFILLEIWQSMRKWKDALLLLLKHILPRYECQYCVLFHETQIPYCTN